MMRILIGHCLDRLDELASPIGIELNPGYVQIGEKRLTQDAGFLFGDPLQIVRSGEPAQLAMF